MKEYKRPPKNIPRSIGHYEEWIEACKGGEKAGSNFGWAGPLTETVQLGNLAILMDGKELKWDSKKFKITNSKEANQYLHRSYRDGWHL